MLECIYEPITQMLSGFLLSGLRKVCLHSIHYRALHFLFYLLTMRILQTFLMTFHILGLTDYHMIETQFLSDITFLGSVYNTLPPLTVSQAEQRPQFISCFWMRPACVCNHYLSYWQMFFIRKESSVIRPKKNNSNRILKITLINIIIK